MGRLSAGFGMRESAGAGERRSEGQAPLSEVVEKQTTHPLSEDAGKRLPGPQPVRVQVSETKDGLQAPCLAMCEARALRTGRQGQGGAGGSYCRTVGISKG